MRTSHPAYGEDLAFIHHTGYGGFADGSAPELLKILDQAGISEGKVVDLGCGSGIWSRQLSDAGYDVVGVDISSSMIALARKNAPRGTFHVASFLEFDLPECHAMTALGEVLSYLFDGRNGAPALRRFFKRAYKALLPGGLLICDLAEVGLDRNRAPGYRDGGDWSTLVQYEYDTKHDQLVRRIVTYRKVGQHFRRSDETHRLQLYRSTDVARMLRDIGFRVRTTRKYGEYPLLPQRMGFIARKP